jgi:hypothetical protein
MELKVKVELKVGNGSEGEEGRFIEREEDCEFIGRIVADEIV